MEQERLVLIYESHQLPEVFDYLKAHSHTRIVCLDFWVERDLTKKNIPFISLQDFVHTKSDEEEWWLLAQNIAREWYRLPALNFFEHKGIRIGEALEPMMEAYLSKLLYYVRVYRTLKGAYPEAQVYIPTPLVGGTSFAGPLAFFEGWAVVDASRMAGFSPIVLGKRVIPQLNLFPRAVWKSFAVRVYNMLISFAPRRGLKIYASEYWPHIAPIIEHMNDSELVLMESSELKNISWRQIFKHRIHVRHPAEAVSGPIKRSATQRGEEWKTQWKIAQKDVVQYVATMHKELNWGPVLEACEYLIAYAPRVIADEEALWVILQDEKPDVVLQRVSISGRQHHFFLMARVAAQLHIPTIELQHAGAYIDPRSVHSHIETDYLASYGTYTNSWYERIGYAPERLISIGSPRFDRCLNERPHALEKGKGLFKQFGLDTARPVLIAAVPFSDENLAIFDSYELAEFFEAVRATQKEIPGLQILFKFRDYIHVGAAREYLQELFPADMAIAGSEDLFALLCASDIAVCGNSTVLYEAMLAQKPLVLYPWKKFHTYHTQMYAPAAPFALDANELVTETKRILTDAAYREILVSRGRRFLAGYAFDGQSATRTVTLLRHQASPNKKRGGSALPYP